MQWSGNVSGFQKLHHLNKDIEKASLRWQANPKRYAAYLINLYNTTTATATHRSRLPFHIISHPSPWTQNPTLQKNAARSAPAEGSLANHCSTHGKSTSQVPSTICIKLVIGGSRRREWGTSFKRRRSRASSRLEQGGRCEVRDWGFDGELWKIGEDGRMRMIGLNL